MTDEPEIEVPVADEPEIEVPVRDEPDAVAAEEDEHAKNRRVRRNLLILSLANWGVAILAWSVSAYLGVRSPASIFVYTVLFVIGLLAATVAIAAYVLERFAHRPEPPADQAAEDGEQDAASTPSA